MPELKEAFEAAGFKDVKSILSSGNVVFTAPTSAAASLQRKGMDAFSAYVRSPKGPVFMTLIERTFGKDVTTRTWETIAKVVR